MNKVNFVFVFSIFLTFVSCKSKGSFDEQWLKKEAPATFKARFETTKGSFDIESHRAWSPKAVDRLYQLIENNFYTDMAIFRVVPDYVAQFGIHDSTQVNAFWNSHKVVDEPVIEKNLEGTMSFARGEKGTRTTQLFINLKNNSPRLDTINYKDVKGFPVIAKITHGMNIVKQFYDDYAEEPGKKQTSIQKKGNRYLKKHFPKLDYIQKAYILK